MELIETQITKRHYMGHKLPPITKFISIDLEMNKPSGKIIQIGACIGDISTGNITDELSIIVNPLEPIDPFITELTGITQEQVDAEGILLEEAYTKLVDYFNLHKPFINSITWGGGDTVEIAKQVKELNSNVFESHPWPFGRRWIDTKTLFVSWRFSQGEPIQGGLAKSMTKVGLKFEGRKHNALDDAKNTFKMYCRMLKLFRPLK